PCSALSSFWVLDYSFWILLYRYAVLLPFRSTFPCHMPAPDPSKGVNYMASTLNAPVSPAEAALRPLSFADFTGQPKTVERLQVMVGAARRRKEALNHEIGRAHV